LSAFRGCKAVAGTLGRAVPLFICAHKASTSTVVEALNAFVKLFFSSFLKGMI
jgi:hypothetical protein